MSEILRTTEWMEGQKLALNNSVGQLLHTWGLKKPIAQMTGLEKKQAGYVAEVLMSAYGLNMEPQILSKIVHGYYPNLDDGLKQNMTENHNSLAVQLVGGIMTPVKYVPVLLSSDKEIGTISPLHVSQMVDGKYQLQFQNGFTNWEFGINFLKPASHAVTNFTYAGENYLGKPFVDACVASNKGGFVLVDSNHPCEQGCKFCTYSQGELKVNPDNFAKLEQVLAFIAESSGKITACLSAGSSLTPDKGILSIFKPMLEIIDKLKQQHSELKIELELELMPWQTIADAEVLALIKKYYDKGYIKAVNLNPETAVGIDRDEYMLGEKFGKANIPLIGSIGEDRGYLETFDLLKKEFPDIQLAGLILYGLKPKDMDWVKYSQLCLKTVVLFAQHQVKLLLQPIKISSSTPMADYPLVDPYWLAGSVLLAGIIHQQNHLDIKPKIGCVNGCDACDGSRSSYSLLHNINKISPEALQMMISPWLDQLKMLNEGEAI